MISNNLYNKPFMLCSNCIPVKGIQRSVICDLGRADYSLIPNSLFEILYNKKIKTFSEAIKCYAQNNNENLIILEEYFEYMIEKDYIFFTSCPEYYTPLDLTWKYPALITNCIIDIYDTDNNLIYDLLTQLEKFGCTIVQFRFYKNVDLETIINILLKLNLSIIDSLEIILPFNNMVIIDEWITLVKTQYRIKFIQFYGAPNDKVLVENPNGRGFLQCVEDHILDEKSCGVISPFHFVSNIQSFTESIKHNTCLNRKISIDTKGYIRNCPSMPEHFGNIKDTTLAQAMEHPDFKKYWFINKDQIEVCKDCEFRYICTDCRAYRENPDDLYSKPLKCGYNPYTAEWEEWSTNPLKQKAIDHYGMREMVSTM